MGEKPLFHIFLVLQKTVPVLFQFLLAWDSILFQCPEEETPSLQASGSQQHTGAALWERVVMLLTTAAAKLRPGLQVTECVTLSLYLM